MLKRPRIFFVLLLGLSLSACKSSVGNNPGIATPAGDFGPIPFEQAPPISALAKVKSLTTGKGLTNNEINTIITNDTIDTSALQSAVATWIDTPEFEVKLRKMLLDLLQQDFEYDRATHGPHVGRLSLGPGDNSFFTSDGNGVTWQEALARVEMLFDNIEQSFVLTALDFYENDAPFNQIANTRYWKVTTGLMVLMAWIDNHRLNNNGNALDLAGEQFAAREMFVGGELDDDDYFSDWRYINFTQAANNTNPTPYTNVGYYAGLGNNDSTSFAIPRVGFFSTVGFRMHWPTNDDNNMRVLVNQTMITALNRTFEVSDSTNQPVTDGIPTSHADPATTCYNCHVLMDPMRNVFTNKMTWAYRYKDSGDMTNLQGSFAFDGYQENVSSVDEFGDAIANHPKFALAWAEKICGYFNSIACAKDDDELKRVAQVFEESGFKLRTLLIEILSSPVITNQTETKTFQQTQGVMSINRKDQFCSAANVRLAKLQALDGQTPMPIDLGKTICLDQDPGQYSDNIPVDTVVRGSIPLSQPSSSNAISNKSLEKLCRELSITYIGGSENVFDLQLSKNNQHLDNLVKHLAGLDTNHPRYTTYRAAVKSIYDQAYTIIGGGNAQRDALREVFRFICESPELSGVSL
ncbi:MAG: hypothetical protein R3A45_06590 [Bdellovibrionota bacterium]